MFYIYLYTKYQLIHLFETCISNFFVGENLRESFISFETYDAFHRSQNSSNELFFKLSSLEYQNFLFNLFFIILMKINKYVRWNSYQLSIQNFLSIVSLNPRLYISIGCLLKRDCSNGTGRGSTPNYIIEVVCFLVR